MTVEPPLEEWEVPGGGAVYAVGAFYSDSPGFNVVDRISRDPQPHIEHRLVPLPYAQARFLAERAEATGNTPGTVLSEIIALVMQDDLADYGQGDHQSVQVAFSDLANRYIAISKGLLESDADLRTSIPSEALAGETKQTAGTTYAVETGESPTAPELSDAELQQAFSEFANEYPAVCEQVFGQQAALSAQLDNRPIRAWAVPIPEEARIGDEAATVAELLDRLTPPARVEPAPSTYIVHLIVDTEVPLVGPAIIYPSPSHEPSQRTSEA